MYRVVKNSKVFYDEYDPYYVEVSNRDFSQNENQEDEASSIEIQKANLRLEKIETQNKAAAIIKDANTKAQMVVAKAKEVAEDMYNREKAAGYEAGLAAADKKISEKLCEIENIQEDFEDRFNDELNQMQQQVISIAMAVSKKVIGKELEKDDILLSVVSTALDKIKEEGKVVIEASQNNVRRFVENGGLENVSFKENKQFSDDDILIHGDSGTVDVSVDKQIDKIEKALEQ